MLDRIYQPALWVPALALCALTCCVRAEAAPIWVKPLTATPTSGAGVVSVKLDWQTSGAVSCTASGLWSGTKAASGTETVTANMSGTFSLKCFEAAKTSYVAALTWTPPTTQTDGSALTTLARYRVIYGKSLTTMTSSALIDAPATGGTVAADSSGTWYFKVRAVRTDGVESLDSQVVSKSLVGTTQAAEFVTSDAPVTITVLPNPPTSLTATEIAYEYRPATKTFAAIGLVPAGAQCGPETRTAGAAKYCRVTLADSRPIVWPQDRKLSEVWVRQ